MKVELRSVLSAQTLRANHLHTRLVTKVIHMFVKVAGIIVHPVSSQPLDVFLVYKCFTDFLLYY